MTLDGWTLLLIWAVAIATILLIWHALAYHDDDV